LNILFLVLYLLFCCFYHRVVNKDLGWANKLLHLSVQKAKPQDISLPYRTRAPRQTTPAQWTPWTIVKFYIAYTFCTVDVRLIHHAFIEYFT